MKLTIFVATIFMAIATVACGKSHDDAKAPSDVTRMAVSNAAARMSHVYLDEGCRFRLRLAPHQSYVDGTYMFHADGINTPVSWGFGLNCHAGLSQEKIYEQLDIKPVSGGWIWVGSNQPFTRAQHFHIMKFSGKNWHGIATGYDMTTGPENLRQRIFGFCLVEDHGEQVLCGHPQGMDTSSPATTKTIEKIMAVLKTIVFVDHSPASGSSAGQ